MASGYKDPGKLKDALALANSFKKGNGSQDKPGGKKRAPSPVRSRYDPSGRTRDYPNVGAHKPFAQSSVSSGPILGTSGMDFLSRKDKVNTPQASNIQKPAADTKTVKQPQGASSTANVSSTAVPVAGGTSQMTQGSPAVSRPPPIVASNGATSGPAARNSIMDSFFSFAPPSLLQQTGDKTASALSSNNTPGNTSTTIPKNALNSTQPPQPVSRPQTQKPPNNMAAGNLMDIDNPEQSQNIGLVGLDKFQPLTAEQKPPSSQLPGLGSSRFASHPQGHFNQTGFSNGQLHTVNQVHSANGSRVPGQTQVLQGSATKEDTRPGSTNSSTPKAKKGLSHSIWAV